MNFSTTLATTPRSLASLLLVLFLGACSTVVPVPSRVSSAPDVSLTQAVDGYGRVLKSHVNDRGEVDFSALRDDSSTSGLPALEQYLRAIASTSLDGSAGPLLNKQARLAHMINAYNAMSMYNVVASGIPATHAGLAKVRFFVLRKFDIGGKVMSLYDFENDIIRKLDEPRIHFALNCSAISCPVLPRVPFTADALDAELDRETVAFFAQPQNLRIDPSTRTVHVSEILKFYTEDFVPKPSPNLIAYVNKYINQPVLQDYAVAFIPYDWTIANSQRAGWRE
jgi:hypothetical protein